MSNEKEMETLIECLRSGKALIFAGAGVGIEAGLPGWKQALNQLANFIEPKDEGIASVMRKRLNSKKYPEAAEAYYIADCDESYRINGIEKIFGTKPAINENLEILAQLGCSNFITTNYCSTIEDAYASTYGRALPILRNTENDFIGAHRHLNQGKPFVIHIHGSIDVPNLIIFCKSHYHRLEMMEEYYQFLRHILMTKSLIFIGFSFNDPALNNFLGYARKKVSLICERPSFAFVPERHSDLANLLEQANVLSIKFNPGENYQGLWELIRYIKEQLEKTEGSPPAFVPEEDEIRKLTNLASVYTHYSLRTKYTSVSDSIFAGIIHVIAHDLETKGVKTTESELTACMAKLLHMDEERALLITKSALSNLVRQGLAKRGDGFLRFYKIDDSIDTDLEKLVHSIRDRAIVRYSDDIKANDQAIREFLLHSLVEDGVRLAHSILTRSPIPSIGIDNILERSATKLFERQEGNKDLLIRATKSLLETPNSEEAKILGEISRMAFLTDLVLHEPDLKSFNIRIRPKILFLDASFLLPAICEYHPRNIYYISLLKKAQENRVKIILGEGFSAEIVMHRKLAMDIFNEQFRERKERYVNYVTYYGSDRMNVFLGAFAAWLEEKKNYYFNDFLRECAPYDSIAGLTSYLESFGIHVYNLAREFSLDKSNIKKWKRELMLWYEASGTPKLEKLCLHEAIQLEAITKGIDQGFPGWFLTADKRFIRASTEISQKGHLRPEITSFLVMPAQLSFLMDLDDERDVDWRGYAKILWSKGFKDHYERFTEFYIDKVLQEYEPKLVVKIPKILEEIREQIQQLPKISEELSKDEVSQMKHLRYLEEFEEKFYKIMRKEKERLGLLKNE